MNTTPITHTDTIVTSRFARRMYFFTVEGVLHPGLFEHMFDDFDVIVSREPSGGVVSTWDFTKVSRLQYSTVDLLNLSRHFPLMNRHEVVVILPEDGNLPLVTKSFCLKISSALLPVRFWYADSYLTAHNRLTHLI